MKAYFSCINFREAIFDVIRASCSKHIGKTLDSLAKRLLDEGEGHLKLASLEKLHFGDFMEPDANPKIYDEISDLAALRVKMQFYLREHLEMRGAPLMTTQYLLQHTTRTCRAIKHGHAILVGRPGSGRNTTAIVSAIISGKRIHVVNIEASFNDF
jgi:dynein heavy chain, axonemal